MKQHLDVAQAPEPTPYVRLWTFNIAVFTFLLTMNCRAAAQTCPMQTASWSAYPLELDVQSPSPGTVQIALKGGTSSLPISNLLGFELELNINANLGAEASTDYISGDAWCARDGQFTVRTAIDPATRRLHLKFRRNNCAAVSGNGPMGELFLTGFPRHFDPAEHIRIGGGIVLEEIVIGAKVAAVPGLGEVHLDDELKPGRANTTLDIQAYPQPAGAQVHLDVQAEKPIEMALYNGQGQKVRELRGPGAGTYTFDLEQLPAGVYWLRSQDATGAQHQQRVLHQ